MAKSECRTEPHECRPRCSLRPRRPCPQLNGSASKSGGALSLQLRSSRVGDLGTCGARMKECGARHGQLASAVPCLGPLNLKKKKRRRPWGARESSSGTWRPRLPANWRRRTGCVLLVPEYAGGVAPPVRPSEWQALNMRKGLWGCARWSEWAQHPCIRPPNSLGPSQHVFRAPSNPL